MFNINTLGTLEPLSIHVSRPDGSLMGCIDDIINEQSTSLSLGINEQYVLSFNTTSQDSPWNEYLQEGMYLFVDKVGLFKMTQPTIQLDGVKEVKNITAYSCDSELEDKTCGVSINMGTKESMEYLVTYDAGEDEELLNPYTGIPYDWILLYNTLPEQLTTFKGLVESGHFGQPDASGEIVVTDAALIEELTVMFNLVPRLKNKIKYVGDDSVLTEYVITKNNGDYITSYTLTSLFVSRISSLITYYTKYGKQLSLLDIVLEETGGAWMVGDISGLAAHDYSLVNSKFQFEINEPIYSFLTKTLATTINCVVNFDILNRRVNVTRIEEIGEDTGIVIGYDTLVKTLNIQTDEDRLATRLRVFGGDDLSITRVNFGSQFVFDLSYKMNTVDDAGNRVYVTDALADKYEAYTDYLEQQRTSYVNLSKQYEDYNKQIDEIKYRVPNDGLQIDWGTYHQDELEESLKQYKNQLAALKSLYKNDYYEQGVNPDGSINETFMKTTMYWYDYQALKTIIDQIECAIAVYPNYDDQTFWTDTQKALYADKIKAWETDWTLFGSNELKAKIDGYKQNMDLLSEESVIRVSESSYVIKTWSQLSDAEKEEFCSDEESYKYDAYMVYYNYMNSAQTYLNGLLAQISALETSRNSVQAQRESIVHSVSMDTYFTAAERKVIYRLFRDSDYTNENIISTSLDTVSEKLDHMIELLEDAKDKVSETSRPQVTFTVESDNLLALPEFEPMWNSFHPGNYIQVQYKDNTYVKVRLIGYKFNPRLVSADSLSMTFSNYTQSRSYYRDWASLLNNASGVSSGSSGSGSGSSLDIDNAIVDSLLSKLLNSETFGTRVTDVILDTIDVNEITARTAKFGGLARGTTLINGKCVQTGYIIDALYNGVNGGITNTAGSIINLETGKFNLGGGNIKYDGNSLAVKGALTADTLSAGGKTYASHNHNGLFIDGNGNIYAGAGSETKIYSDGTFDLCNGVFIWDGSTLSIDDKLQWRSSDSTLTIKGILKADTGYIGGANGWTIASQKLYSGTLGAINGMYLGTADLGSATIDGHQDTKWRFVVGSKFGILNDGTVYGSDMHLTGDIVARSLDLSTNNVKVSTDDISGLAAIATSGDIDDLVGKNTILYKGDVTYSEEVVDEHTGVKAVTSTWVDSNGVTRTNTTYTSPNGGYVLCDVGMGTYGEGTQGYILSTSGLLRASNAIIYGTIYANAGLIGDCLIENGVLSIGQSNVTGLPQALEDISDDIDDINGLIDDIVVQVDSRIETWAQNSDPSTGWAQSELPAHDGDLWYYTGLTDLTVNGVTIKPSKTYRYNNTTGKWVLYNSPSKSLFDLADGKCKIFYGSPTDTFTDVDENDYLVDGTTGKTYKRSSGSWVLVTDYATAITNATTTLRTDLEAQIDAKIETWAQDTDPVSSWGTDLASHDKDLWLYTGITELTAGGVVIKPSQTYQYNYTTGKWAAYTSISRSLFDLADGKSTIFYGGTSETYTNVKDGDYLVDQSGCTYRRESNAWVKVTDYNTAIATAVNALESTLEAQIDAKVETWAQNTNPATLWPQAELESHDGDLWYYTGITDLTVGSVTIKPSKTYQYNYSTGAWVLYNSPTTSLFDLADGKATVYYGTYPFTSITAQENDMAINTSDKKLYRYNGSSWDEVTNYKSTTDALATTVSTMGSSLEAQIDAKIETWAQDTNPATSWGTDIEEHDGDFWLYTGITDLTIGGATIKPAQTYKYDYATRKWVAHTSISRSLFDLADGKSTVFYGTTSGTYTNVKNGDYLVDPADGSTYKRENNAWTKVTDYGSAITTAVDALESTLEAQIDAKVETWAQNTNPASSWASADKEKHDGDLWYYTGVTDLTVGSVTVKPTKTYQYHYSTDSWTLYNSPTNSLFDLADGKSTVYYGTYPFTSITASTKDIAIDSSTKKIYRYNGSSWDEVNNYSSAISTLETSLKSQIDAKIETWAQNENPASSWASSDRATHDGDLWYYTGITNLTVGSVTIEPSKTYEYDATNNTWSQYKSPSTSLFDFADGKATVYYDTYPFSSITAKENDVAIDSSNKKLYRYNGSSWDEVTNYNSAVNALETSLKSQIDAKIETWAQMSDPSSSWTAAQKQEHDGDLWYYIGTENSTTTDSAGNYILPSKTYKYVYSTDKWVPYNSPSVSLFDLTDGKSTVYYGTYPFTSITAGTKDIAIDSTTKKIYRYNGSSWDEINNYSSAISTLETSLKTQIDAKIETWAKDSDPSTSWTTTELRNQHNGDLWYYTGITESSVTDSAGNKILPSKTYKYIASTAKWEVYDGLTRTLFDLVDGKSTIRYGSASGTYANLEENDYLIDSDAGCTYKWNGSSWLLLTNYRDPYQIDGLELGNNLCDVSVAKTDDDNKRVFSKWVKYNGYVHLSSTTSTSSTSPALLTFIKACDFQSTDYITVSFNYSRYSGSSTYTVYAVLNYYNSSKSVLSSYTTSKSFSLSSSSGSISVDLPFSSKPSTAVYYSVGLYSTSNYPMYYYMFKNLQIIKGVGGFITDNSSIRIGAANDYADGNITLSANEDFSREINGTTRTGLRMAIGSKFGVGSNGKLYATDAYFDGNGYFAGEIHAASGEFSGSITGSSFATATKTWDYYIDGSFVVYTTNAVKIDTNSIRLYNDFNSSCASISLVDTNNPSSTNLGIYIKNYVYSNNMYAGAFCKVTSSGFTNIDNLYAGINHNHDYSYASITHDHSGTYAPYTHYHSQYMSGSTSSNSLKVGNILIQWGESSNIGADHGMIVEETIQFSTAYSSTPRVFVSPRVNNTSDSKVGNLLISTRDITTSSFKVKNDNANTVSGTKFDVWAQWVAIGVKN